MARKTLRLTFDWLSTKLDRPVNIVAIAVIAVVLLRAGLDPASLGAIVAALVVPHGRVVLRRRRARPRPPGRRRLRIVRDHRDGDGHAQ